MKWCRRKIKNRAQQKNERRLELAGLLLVWIAYPYPGMNISYFPKKFKALWNFIKYFTHFQSFINSFPFHATPRVPSQVTSHARGNNVRSNGANRTVRNLRIKTNEPAFSQRLGAATVDDTRGLLVYDQHVSERRAGQYKWNSLISVADSRKAHSARSINVNIMPVTYRAEVSQSLESRLLA